MADKDTNEEALSQPEEGVDANVSDDQATSDPSDKMSPDHPRFKEVYNDMKTYKAESEQLQSELKDLKQEMEEIRSQAQERGQQGGDTEFTQEELQAIEKIDKALKKRGYVTNEQLNEKEAMSPTSSLMRKKVSLTEEWSLRGCPKSTVARTVIPSLIRKR